MFSEVLLQNVPESLKHQILRLCEKRVFCQRVFLCVAGLPIFCRCGTQLLFSFCQVKRQRLRRRTRRRSAPAALGAAGPGSPGCSTRRSPFRDPLGAKGAISPDRRCGGGGAGASPRRRAGLSPSPGEGARRHAGQRRVEGPTAALAGACPKAIST